MFIEVERFIKESKLHNIEYHNPLNQRNSLSKKVKRLFEAKKRSLKHKGSLRTTLE
jgi:hypothetical protein